MAKTAKRKAPSRARYEQAHPTVSCRISKEIYHRLEKAKKANGRSFADVLKIGLGILEVQAKKEAEVWKQAHTAGYRIGYADASRTFKVTYPCSICRETLTVTSTDEKEDIKRYMQQTGWGHQACHEKSR